MPKIQILVIQLIGTILRLQSSNSNSNSKDDDEQTRVSRGPKISLENSSEDPVSGSWSLFVLPPKCNRAGCSKKQRGVWSGGIEARIELVDRVCYGQCRFYHYWDQHVKRQQYNVKQFII